MYHEIVLAGVAISLLFAELTGLSPAGLVVPGYIALSLQTPQRVVYTLVLAFAAWGIAKFLARFMILYGRRRFAVLILLAFVVDLAVNAAGILSYDPGMIGVLVPGIIAQEMEKQGVVKSMLSLGVVVGILVLLMLWQGMRVFPV
ncbi:MAG: poly-gamma-glutamate biosynthesis protein PgsC [Clostridium sp.]|nr:poly-gamma-glutamate biosynthesis protein PgsC [Clostridium sp.]